MLEFIAGENIRRFRAQLDGCTDAEQKKTLLNLIREERERLAEAQSGSAGS